jgi:hypothetical protein
LPHSASRDRISSSHFAIASKIRSSTFRAFDASFAGASSFPGPAPALEAPFLGFEASAALSSALQACR